MTQMMAVFPERSPLVRLNHSSLLTVVSLQVGTAGRSEKIRTYNFAQDRITDHRVGVSVHNLAECLAGGWPLAKLIDTLHEAHRKELAHHLISKQLYQ